MQHCSYLGCPLDVLKTESGFVEKLASYVFTFFGATFMVFITIDSLYVYSTGTKINLEAKPMD